MDKLNPPNFVTRFNHQSCGGSTSAYKVRASNRSFIYSRYRPSRVFKPVNDEYFYSCAFTHDNQCLLLGSNLGEISVFNKHNGDLIAQKNIHRYDVISLVPHKTGELLLTSGDFESTLWNIKNNFEYQFNLSCHVAEFSHAQDKLLGTSKRSAKLYDLNSGDLIHEFKPKILNLYEINKPSLNPSDELLLTDGVLFDVRSGKEVHKFEKNNPYFSGVFHSNRLEIINSAEIWDLRNFHLLETVENLEFCDIKFNNYGDIIFGLPNANYSGPIPTKFEILDATDYSSIATLYVHRNMGSLIINPTDTQIAVIEDTIRDRSIVQLFDIGMVRHEEEVSELVDEDNDDDDEDENYEDVQG